MNKLNPQKPLRIPESNVLKLLLRHQPAGPQLCHKPRAVLIELKRPINAVHNPLTIRRPQHRRHGIQAKHPTRRNINIAPPHLLKRQRPIHTQLHIRPLQKKRHQLPHMPQHDLQLRKPLKHAPEVHLDEAQPRPLMPPPRPRPQRRRLVLRILPPGHRRRVQPLPDVKHLARIRRRRVQINRHIQPHRHRPQLVVRAAIIRPPIRQQRVDQRAHETQLPHAPPQLLRRGARQPHRQDAETAEAGWLRRRGDARGQLVVGRGGLVGQVEGFGDGDVRDGLDADVVGVHGGEALGADFRQQLRGARAQVEGADDAVLEEEGGQGGGDPVLFEGVVGGDVGGVGGEACWEGGVGEEEGEEEEG